MGIRTKTLGWVGATVVVMVGLFAVWSFGFLAKEFMHLEKSELQRNAHRMNEVMSNELQNVHENIVDWARWDLYYRYSNQQDPQFLTDNFTPTTPMGLGVNMIASVDLNAKVQFSLVSDELGPATRQINDLELSSLLNAGLAKGIESLKVHPGSTLHESMLVNIDSKVLLVSWHNAEPTKGAFASKSILIFGRWLDKPLIEKMQKTLGDPLQVIIGPGIQKLPQEVRSLQADSAYHQFHPNQTTTLWSSRFNSQGQQIAVLQAEFEREVMTVGRTVLQYTLVGAAVFGFMLLVVIGLLNERIVLRPLIALSRAVKERGPSSEQEIKVLEVSDELMDLQEVLNESYRSILQSHHEIAERNRDRIAMFSALEHGLLTLDVEGRILPNYAPCTETILDASPLEGRDFADLLLRRSTLEPDVRHYAINCLQACLNGDEFQFTVNRDGLPREVKIKAGMGRLEMMRTFEVDYTPMYDASGWVERMLVVIRDVTHLKELEAKADLQKDELILIQHLLELSPQDLDRFCNETESRIVKVRDALKQGPLTDVDLYKLARDLHTLKGNSRVFGLRDMAGAVHAAEEPVMKMLHQNQTPELLDMTWKRLGWILEEEEKIRAFYMDRFHRLLENRGTGLLSMPKEQVEQYLERFAEVSHSPGRLRQFLEEIQWTMQGEGVETLHSIALDQETGPDQLRAMLQSMARSAFLSVTNAVKSLERALAEDAELLNKPMPNLDLPKDDVLIREQFAQQLKDTLGHLMRNSLDHGIESPTERLQLGKPEQGTIRLEATLELGAQGGEQPVLWYSDDGRGLDLSALRQKARDLGEDCEDWSVLELVETIFRPGFSTRDAVSEISGRGIGMDAVRAIWEEVGGNVLFDMPPTIDGDFIPLRLRIGLPRLSVLFFANEAKPEITCVQTTATGEDITPESLGLHALDDAEGLGHQA